MSGNGTHSLKHLAIIPDGNRRWAHAQGLPSLEGHRRGYEQVKKIGLAALEMGIEHFSLWAFSSENWKRSSEEVQGLMFLLMTALTKELNFYLDHDVRLRVIGQRADLSPALQKAIENAEAKTAAGTRGQFNLYVNYGGHQEIVEAVKSLVRSGVLVEEITEERLQSVLWTGDLPPPDLIIRTSGEQRLSGFMSWASAYSEYLFEPRYWPDFSVEDLDRCIRDFEQRERRFGG